MGLLDKFKKSKLGVQTEDNPSVTPYQQTVLQEYAVRFKSTLDSSQFDSYTRIEQVATFGGSPLPPVYAADYLVTENSNFLMTENNNNLII